MSTIRPKLKELLDILSELNNPPLPAASLPGALDTYLKVLKEFQKKHAEEVASRDLFAELVNSNESTARQRLNGLSDVEFKKFCVVNRIKPVKGKKEKRVKGKVLQKAVKAKKATKKKPAQSEILERREPDIVVPAQTDRQATTAAVISQAFQLKNQATI